MISLTSGSTPPGSEQLTRGAALALLEFRTAALERRLSDQTSRFAAWVRYGGRSVDSDEIAIAAARYRVALLQPWELDARAQLKERRPDMVVLCYKCLSSARSSEVGRDIVSSGVSFAEAERHGEDWFAHRPDGRTRVEWKGFGGHWQMAVWDDQYRRRWRENVVSEVVANGWDGVFADNDIYGDYYGILPLEGAREMGDIRDALECMVEEVGDSLNDAGKLLIPNIAESRREHGRWARHARFGGGFEEQWLGWSEKDHFDAATCLQQAAVLCGPGVGIVRVNSDGDGRHINFLFGLAAFWVLGRGKGWAYTATPPNEYSGVPYLPQQSWDLGAPIGPTIIRGNGRGQRFTNGWAAVNLGTAENVGFEVPDGLTDEHAQSAPAVISLLPKEGMIFIATLPTEVAYLESSIFSLDTARDTVDARVLEISGAAELRDGVLRIKGTTDYQGAVTSRRVIDLMGLSARVQTGVLPKSPSGEALLILDMGGDDLFAIGKSGDRLILRLRINGHDYDDAVPFDPDLHRWWGIDSSESTVHWVAAPDGLDWRIERELLTEPRAKAEGRVSLVVGHYNAGEPDEDAEFHALEIVESR